MQQEVHTNEIIGLMHSLDPERLQELKQKFPQYAAQLEPGITLGNEKSQEEGVVKGVDSAKRQMTAFRAELCKSGLETILETIPGKIAGLRKRIKSLRNIQLVSQIVIAVSGASIFALLGKEMDWVNRLAAVLALLGSVLTLIAKQRETGTISGSESLTVMYDKLVESEIKATANHRELNVLKEFVHETGQWDKLSELVNRTNSMSEELQIMLSRLS